MKRVHEGLDSNLAKIYQNDVRTVVARRNVPSSAILLENYR
jgi:hypothetical protein